MTRYEKFSAEWRSLSPEQRTALLQRMTTSLEVLTRAYRQIADAKALGVKPKELD